MYYFCGYEINGRERMNEYLLKNYLDAMSEMLMSMKSAMAYTPDEKVLLHNIQQIKNLIPLIEGCINE